MKYIITLLSMIVKIHKITLDKDQIIKTDTEKLKIICKLIEDWTEKGLE